MSDSRELRDVLASPPASLPPAPAPASAHEHPQDTSSPLAQLGNVARERLLDMRTMPAGLRLAALIGIALIVLSGALVVLRDIMGGGGIFGPTVALTLGGGNVALSDIIVIAAFLILLYGWTCVLAGALHSYGFPVPLALLAFTVFNGAYLTELDWSSLSPQLAVLIAAPIVPLVLIWGWAMFVQIMRHRAWQRGRTEPAVLIRWTFGVIFTLQLLFDAPSIVNDLFIAHGPSLIASIASEQGAFFFIPAVYVFFLSSSDLIETADSLATGAVALTRRALRSRSAGAVPLLTAIAAAVSCFLIVKLAHDQSLSPTDLALNIVLWLILAVVVLGLLVAIAWLGRIGGPGGPVRTVPLAILIVVTIVLEGSLSVLAEVGPSLVRLLHPTDPADFLFIVLSGPVPIAVGCLCGIPLLIAGRSRPGGGASVAGVFSTALGVYGLFKTLPYLIALAGGPSPDATLFTVPGGHIVVTYFALLLSDTGIAMVTALLSFGALIALAVTRRISSPAGAALVKALLALNVGLLALDALGAYYSAPGLSGAALGVQAVLVVGAFLWDLLTSGQITNHSGRMFPRPGRVLIYMGYSLLLTVSVVLSLGAQTTAAATAVGQPASATYVQVGLEMIGIPLLYTLAIQRIAQSWRLTRAAPTPGTTQRPPQAIATASSALRP